MTYGDQDRPVTHLVVIVREGEPSVTEFRSEEDARAFFDPAQTQWSESYLCEVRQIGMRVLPHPALARIEYWQKKAEDARASWEHGALARADLERKLDAAEARARRAVSELEEVFALVTEWREQAIAEDECQRSGGNPMGAAAYRRAADELEAMRAIRASKEEILAAADCHQWGLRGVDLVVLMNAIAEAVGADEIDVDSPREADAAIARAVLKLTQANALERRRLDAVRDWLRAHVDAAQGDSASVAHWRAYVLALNYVTDLITEREVGPIEAEAVKKERRTDIERIALWLDGLEYALGRTIEFTRDPEERRVLIARRGIYEGIASEVRGGNWRNAKEPTE